MTVCDYCQKPLQPGDRIYYEVVGWEEDRKAGGTHALRLRKRTGRAAHWHCVDLAAKGRTGQEELFTIPGTTGQVAEPIPTAAEGQTA